MSSTYPETHGSAVSAELRAFNQLFATLRFDGQGRIVGANHQFLRLLGYDLQELLGQEDTFFVSKSYERSQQLALWRNVRKGKPQQQTALWVSKSGKELWLNCRYMPLADEEGTITEVVQVIEDITEREAREADARGQLMAINRTQAVVHFSLDGHVLEANELFLNAVGYDHDTLVGKHHSVLVDNDERASEAYRAFWAGLGQGEHRSGEYRRIRQDGREVWLQAVYSPILDAAGRPLKVVKYATDITEAKMRQADYQWQITAIHKSNLVITFDMFGAILDANDLFLEATGYDLAEIEGRHHRMFVDPAYAHGSEYQTFWRELRQGKHRMGHYKRFGKNGREVWLHATYNPIFDADGKPVKVVKYASVVTDEKLIEAECQGQIAAIHKAQCVISFALDGTILDVNENFLDATGYRYADVMGRHHRMFVSETDAVSEEYQAFWRDLAAGCHQAGEYRRVCKDGSEIWLQATYSPIFDMNGRPFKVVKYAIDVTADKLMQAGYRGQIEAINKSQAVAVFGLDGVLSDANENFLDLFGYGIDELKGAHHSMFVERDFYVSDEYVTFWEMLRSGKYHSGLYKRLAKNGREVWIQASYNPVLDLNGKPVSVIKYATDVSSNVALAEAFEDARRQAHHDAATSLPNRVKLASFMDASLAGPGAALTVFYIDLDRFKPVNDTYGHHVGDRVLGEVADRMRRMIDEDQMVARVGGDEFVIVAPGMAVENIEAFCRRLIETVTKPIPYESGEISIGMSIGIAVAPTDGETPDDLLRAADAALYRSKQNGRGVYSFFSMEMNDRIVSQRRLAEDMRHSLAAGDFYLEFQPRFDTRKRCVRSAEALVRWAHPERGRIPPADFIPLAERNGMIVPLGDWILRAACTTAMSWDGIGVSVNVSPAQFRDPQFVQKVRDCLAETALPADLLELEITEGVLLEDADRAVAVLKSLKALGVKLAMDDFGTGYSSLSYLRNFPFDVIKIDRSFITDLEADGSARSIVQAILGLGQALGLSVTAEGVETNEQLAVLTADHCSEVQGFLMAKPLRAEKLQALFSEMPELNKTIGEGILKSA